MKSTTTTNSPSRLSTAAILCAGFTFEGRGGFSFMSTENWRSVVGYEGRYLVSSEGRIKSIFGRKNPRKRPFNRKLRLINGYWTVDLKANGESRTFKVARLVAAAFHGDCPEGMEVAHKNGNSHDDRSDNLKYTTHRDNLSHRIEHGTHYRGTQNPAAKLTDEQHREIIRLRATGLELKAIGAMFGVTKSHVCGIAKGRFRKHLL